MKALYICSFDPNNNTNSYFQDWMQEFEKSGFQIFNSFNQNLSKLINLFNPYYYDVIVFGYSSLTRLDGRAKQVISYLTKISKAVIVGFLQNEFRNLSTLLESYRCLNVNVIVSQLSQDLATEIYSGRTNAKILSLPHAMSQIIKNKNFDHKYRSIDLFGRLREYAYYLGNHPRQFVIPEFIKKIKTKTSLKVDFSTNENARLNYNDWNKFLQSSRTAISCESGNFFLQWSDNLRNMINALIKKKKNITFSYILNNILHNSDHHFHGGVVSSRHFDAIANGSCNLLVEGSYQGLFEANKHYIKLNKDLSNYHQVVEMLKDFRLTEDIANRAYKHCLKYHTIKKRIAYLLKNI